MADSISFEPSVTQRIFPKKNTSFLIKFFPKFVCTTLEYFTIFSINDPTEMVYKTNYEQIDETIQKVTVCVQGSCYGNTCL